MSPRAWTLPAFFALLVGTTGCYRMTIHSGQPEAPGKPAIDSSTRGGFLNGIAEDQPTRLNGVCEHGWSTIHVETGFLNGLVDTIRGLIYFTQNVTLTCAPPQALGPAPVVRVGPAAVGPTVILVAPQQAPVPAAPEAPLPPQPAR